MTVFLQRPSWRGAILDSQGFSDLAMKYHKESHLEKLLKKLRSCQKQNINKHILEENKDYVSAQDIVQALCATKNPPATYLCIKEKFNLETGDP